MGLLALLAAVGIAAAGSFNGCEEPLKLQPEERVGYRCMYMAARGNGDWTGAAARLDQLIAADPARGWALLERANVANAVGEEVAPALYRRARATFVERGEPAGEVYALLGLVTWLVQSGQEEEGRTAGEEALALARATRNPALVATARAQQARFLASTDLLGAWEAIREAEPVALSGEDYQLKVVVLTVLSNLSMDMGRVDEALEYKRRLVLLSAAAGDRYVEAVARVAYIDWSLLIGRLRGEADEAGLLDRAFEAQAVADASGNPYAIADAWCLIGNLDPSMKRWPAFDRCLHDWTLLAEPDRIASAEAGYALATFKTDPEGARAGVERALFQAQASGYELQEAEIRYIRARMAWDSGDPRALAWSLEHLALAERIQAAERDDQSRVARTGEWTFAWTLYASHLLDQGNIDQAFRLTERMRAVALANHLRAAKLQPSTQGGPARPGIAELQAALSPNQGMLIFYVATGFDYFDPSTIARSWVTRITRDEVRVFDIRDGNQLEEPIELYRGLFEEGDGGEQPGGARLYDALLARPLEGMPAGVNQLILVADGALHKLPFAALAAPGQPALSQRYALSFPPSASLWLSWRGEQGVEGAASLVLADPSPAQVDLPPLPGALLEGQEVAGRIGGRLLSGAAATEAGLRELATPPALLHIAAHAEVNEAHPERSRVVLSPAGMDDGLLHMSEIVTLPLDGTIVVLSGCSTAAGTVTGGEGAQSLARAFFLAGAPTVIASLWPLRDDEAARFFDAFYAALGRGLSVDRAAQAASTELLQDGAPARVWAGIVVLGDGGRVPFPVGKGGHPLALALGAALLLSIAGGLILRRHRFVTEST